MGHPRCREDAPSRVTFSRTLLPPERNGTMHLTESHKAYENWLVWNMPERTDENAEAWATEDAFTDALSSVNIPSFETVRDTYRKAPSSPETLALLCARYPFLVPRGYPYGFVAINPFDAASDVGGSGDERCPGLSPHGMGTHDRSMLGGMPDGWAFAFGVELCEDVRTILIAMEPDGISDTEQLLTYRVSQVKEKFGELRWYAGGGLVREDLGSANGRRHDGIARQTIDGIVELYSHVSGRCCATCGTFDDVRLTRGWVCPICRSCWEGEHEKLIQEMRRHPSRYGGADADRMAKVSFEDDTDTMRPHGPAEGSCAFTVYDMDGREDVSYYDLIVPQDSPARKALGIVEPLRIEGIYARMLEGQGQQDAIDEDGCGNGPSEE